MLKVVIIIVAIIIACRIGYIWGRVDEAEKILGWIDDVEERNNDENEKED